MHRIGSWILVFIVTLTCCESVFAQRGWRDDSRDRRRSRDWDRDRWDWGRERYWEYDNHRRPDYVFGKKAYLERLSSDLYQQTNSICWEMHRFYQDNREYRTTYAEMYEVREGAKRIRDLVRESYHRSRHDNDRISRELEKLDRQFHHIDDDIIRWRPNSREAYRGGDLHAKMAICEDTLHDLMEDYGFKRSHTHGGHDRSHGHTRRHDRKYD